MAEKKTKRLAFNFLRSYFDVFNELENNDDKVNFISAILNKQFLDEDPEELNFIVKLCYQSQKHAIEKSVKGWLSANKTDMQGNPIEPPTLPKGSPLTLPKGEVQEEEQVKVKEEEKEKEKKEIIFSFRKSLCALGLEKNLVDDFIKNRKTKRLANTETAFNNLVIEFKKTDMEINKLMTTVVSNGWGSFKKSWLEKEKSSVKKEKRDAMELLMEKHNLNGNS